ncbi:MAG TPA: L,D-transpeptidase family protein [Actinomycetota bacterium]|nr:L,D-transpeptidase family protein [Actinomycetota bacterium]
MRRRLWAALVAGLVAASTFGAAPAAATDDAGADDSISAISATPAPGDGSAAAGGAPDDGTTDDGAPDDGTTDETDDGTTGDDTDDGTTDDGTTGDGSTVVGDGGTTDDDEGAADGGAAEGEEEPQPDVTIHASRKRVAFGGTVRLTGEITPAAGGQTVEIVDDSDGSVLGRDETGNRGRYEVTIAPRHNVAVRARWAAVQSAPVALRVAPVVTSKLHAVRLFGRVRVNGYVRPARPGESVTVQLLRWGDPVSKKRVRLNRKSWYSTKFLVRKPGGYRARVTFDAPDLVARRDATALRETPLPSLGPGAHNVYVRLLETRLVALNYHLQGVNSRYDVRTADAIRAFNKVQRRPRLGTVGESTWRALADPRRPHARDRSAGFHVEVDQTKQVLYTVVDGKITNVLHVSTGKPSTPTYDGVYRFFRKLAGYSPHRLYYPSYFHEGRAIHGWPSVPTYNASHGCVRVPMWAATWIYGKVDVGDEIRIYH